MNDDFDVHATPVLLEAGLRNELRELRELRADYAAMDAELGHERLQRIIARDLRNSLENVVEIVGDALAITLTLFSDVMDDDTRERCLFAINQASDALLSCARVPEERLAHATVMANAGKELAAEHARRVKAERDRDLFLPVVEAACEWATVRSAENLREIAEADEPELEEIMHRAEGAVSQLVAAVAALNAEGQ